MLGVVAGGDDGGRLLDGGKRIEFSGHHIVCIEVTAPLVISLALSGRDVTGVVLDDEDSRIAMRRPEKRSKCTNLVRLRAIEDSIPKPSPHHRVVVACEQRVENRQLTRG